MRATPSTIDWSTADAPVKNVRIYLLPFLILSIAIFLTSFIIAEGTTLTTQGALLHNFRILFAVLGPLSAFGFYVIVSLLLTGSILLEEKRREIILFTTLSSIIGVLFAIALESRSVLVLISLILAGIEFQQVEFILAAVVAPIAEELSKIIPLVMLTRLVYLEGGKEKRLVSQPQTFIFLAVLSGSIFNVLETYLYTWYSGYTFDLLDSQQWFDVSRQIILRSFNPLHLTSVLLASLGILIAFWNSTESFLTRSSLYPVLGSYTIAVVLHAMWNGSLVLMTEDTATYELFGIELPLFNFVLLIICQVALLVLLIGANLVDVATCTYCGEWHTPPYEREKHQVNYHYAQSMISSIFRSDTLEFSCENCGHNYVGKRCPNCRVTKTFACGNCHYPYPVYENSCWKCGKKVETVYDGIMNFHSNDVSDLSVAFILFFSSIYVIIFLQLVVSLPSLLGDDISDIVLVSYLLYLIIGIAMVAVYNWSRGEKNAVFGKIISRYILSIAVLQVGMFLLGFGLMISVLFSSILVLLVTILIFVPFLFLAQGIFNTGIMVIY